MGGILALAVRLLIVYIIYKVIVDFIIPLYKTTKVVRGQVNDMKRRMDEQEKKQTQNTTTVESKPRKEDYIDFEEVK